MTKIIPIDGVKHIDQTDVCYDILIWNCENKTRKVVDMLNIIRKYDLFPKIYIGILIVGNHLSMIVIYKLSKSYHDITSESI